MLLLSGHPGRGADDYLDVMRLLMRTAVGIVLQQRCQEVDALAQLEGIGEADPLECPVFAAANPVERGLDVHRGDVKGQKYYLVGMDFCCVFPL